jgi:hypothetical protein
MGLGYIWALFLLRVADISAGGSSCPLADRGRSLVPVPVPVGKTAIPI